MIDNILIVCEGNICRSPMAQGLFAAQLPASITVASAGTNALAGRPADPIAIELMALRGIDINNHKGAQLDSRQIRSAQLILAMTAEQRKLIESIYAYSRGKVYRILEHDSVDVVDPFRKSRTVFEAALEQIDSGVTHWLKAITRLS